MNKMRTMTGFQGEIAKINGVFTMHKASETNYSQNNRIFPGIINDIETY